MNVGIIAVFGLIAAAALGRKSIADEITAVKDSFTQWDADFKAYGAAYGVPWMWLKAICMNESRLGEESSVARGLAAPTDVEGSKSSDGKSWGLMQLTIPTARDFEPYITAAGLNDPKVSIRIAARFLSRLMRSFATVDLRYQEWVIKSYNQGQGNTAKERAGTIEGYAEPYWERFQRNLAMVESKQGE